MEKYWIKLEWDSEFFGFNVARIIRLDLDAGQLAAVLRELKRRRYRLVYWNIPAGNQPLVDIALRLGGFIADEKTTYVKDLANIPAGHSDGPFSVIPYTKASLEPALLSLALSSGEFSRFKLDPLFPTELFEKLYTCWVIRSVRKEIARQVLVAKEGSATIGMISLGEKEGRGDIGLVAVCPEARGKRIGQQLVAAADHSFFVSGYTLAQVVTQRVNKSACGLYEGCGYRVEKIENVLHFWLQTNENPF